MNRNNTPLADFPTLETPRLVLRELTLADAPALFAIHGDRSAMRHFGADAMTQPEQASELIVKFAAWRKAANPGVRWAIQRKSDGTLVGTCGVFAWNRDWRKCSTGYELAQRAWGQGFMREALASAFAWAFDAMDLNRIEAQVHPDNAPSLKLLQGLGFHREGLLREVGRWNGQFHDLVQLGLLRKDWAPFAGATSS